MATWGIHFRMAEALIHKGWDVDTEGFVVGNIGPDCGAPNADWTKFDPPTEISHWSDGGKKNINAHLFFDTYLSQPTSDKHHFSFLLGYFVHLLTDIAWTELYYAKKEQSPAYQEILKQSNYLSIIKEDWYDLDHVYLRNNKDSVFHHIFQHIQHFPDYLPYYPQGAVNRQIQYITSFYQNTPDTLDRDYIYLSLEEMDAFVEKTATSVHEVLLQRLGKVALEVLPYALGVFQMDMTKEIPTQVFQSQFYTLTRTDLETSLICEETFAPKDPLKQELGWVSLRVVGVLNFSLIGILAGISRVLAEAGISVFVISTFDTDYILIKAIHLEKAVKVLRENHYPIA